jgi:1-acyl-sn-glycerol-3-phosphate acyltransferase
MGPLGWILTYAGKLGLRILYRIDASEMRSIRAVGPLIVYANHTGIIEAPVIYTFLRPRKKVTGLSKIENWKNPLVGLVFSSWGIIPLRRGETDMEALRAAIGALKDGFFLGVAPEGTRSRTGKLQRAQSGITLLALRADSPLQPVALWDDRPLPDPDRPGRRGRRLFERPVLHLRVGRAFRLDARDHKITREIRQEMTDEIMYQLATLLPEERQGEYSDLGRATEKWLAFED